MRRCGGIQSALNWLLGFGAVLGVASSATALPQFVPSPGARLHTVTSGQPGATYNTQGAGDNVSYDSNTGLLSISGVIDELNWYDPANGACATDAGSNCNLNYSPDLTLTVQALFLGINAVNLGGGVDLDNIRSDANDVYAIFKGQLTVSLTREDGSVYTTDVVTVPSTTSATSDLQVNQAIKEAINSDPVLSKLLLAYDGPANSLVVVSRIDEQSGATASGLSVDIAAPAAGSLTGSTRRRPTDGFPTSGVRRTSRRCERP